MRGGFWIESLLALVLVVAPFLGGFAQDRAATYTDLVVGILLDAWAIVDSVNSGGPEIRRNPARPGPTPHNEAK